MPEHDKHQIQETVPEMDQAADLRKPLLHPFAVRGIHEQVLFPISVNLAGTSAQTSGNYGEFFVANRAYQVVSISERHSAAASQSGTIQVNKLASGTTTTVSLLADGFDTAFATSTVIDGTLTTTRSDLTLKDGDSLALSSSGTIDTIQNVAITILLKQL